MKYPYDCADYRREIGEGCTLPELPRLNPRNGLVFEIYQMSQSLMISHKEVLELLTLRLTEIEHYVLVVKLMKIKEIISGHDKTVTSKTNDPNYISSDY